MKVKNIGYNIILLIAENQYELSSTFIRLQEFYESPYPNIRGKDFTLEEFMDIYAADRDNFTYFEDWEGFNVPGNIVNNFFTTVIGLREKEINLFRLIQSEHDMSDNNFYVIGCIDGDEETIKHEVAHALFYLNKDYNKQISKLAKDYKKKHPKKVKSLLKQGYDKDFIIDELQAYNVEKIKQYKGIFEKYVKVCKIKI